MSPRDRFFVIAPPQQCAAERTGVENGMHSRAPGNRISSTARSARQARSFERARSGLRAPASRPTACARVEEAVSGSSSLKRVDVAPDVPTMVESGLPGFETLVWFGLFAPVGTPSEIVAKLSAEVGKIVHQPGLRETFALQGLTPVGSNSPQFAAKVSKEHAIWGKVIREAGIKLD